MSSAPRVAPPAEQTGHVLRDSALGRVAETVDPWVDLNYQVWFGGAVEPAALEVARLRNARTVNCVFCRSVRYDVARADGLTEALVEQIDDGYENSALSERHKLVLAFTDKYLNDPHGLDTALRQRLLAEFGADGIAHLAYAVALFNGFSKCAVSLGGMPDELPVTEISVPTA